MEPTEKQPARWTKLIILSGWFLTILVAVIILSTSMVMMVMYPEVPLPKPLSEWGSIVLGFLFGSFVNIVSNVITKD